MQAGMPFFGTASFYGGSVANVNPADPGLCAVLGQGGTLSDAEEHVEEKTHCRG